MLTRLDLNRISPEAFLSAARASLPMTRFKHPAITGAPEAIARLKGKSSFASLEEQQRGLMQLGLHTGFAAAHHDWTAHLCLVDTDNYEVQLTSFNTIDMSLRVIFPDKKQFKGVQLAANYGPYLLYLREALGITGITGIDIDGAACRYAKDQGIPVIKTDARQLPFPDSSQEIVLSWHFLDPSYCALIDQANGLFADPGNSVFLREALKEAHRVLQPSGILVSSLEFDTDYSDFAPFTEVHRFPPALQKIFPPIDDVVILQKEAA